MPSWQARILNSAIRTFVRRENWGDDAIGVARRARRLFGPPPVYQWLRARGLTIERISASEVRGEWIVPPNAGTGVILYIHGGGFVSCSAATQRPITAQLARLTGFRVFSVDYRLAPEHPFPAGPDDVFNAYRWLREQGISADKISAAGDSAGGGLMLTLLLKLRDAGLPMPACGVGFSAWTDLAGTGASVQANNGKCDMFRPNNIVEFAAAYLDGVSPLDPYASPLHADLGGLPPILLQVGSTELLLDDSRIVCEKITAPGGTCKLEVFDDVAHDWHLLTGLVPEADEALSNAAAFIRKHTAAAEQAV